jgi:hypothetical protein
MRERLSVIDRKRAKDRSPLQRASLWLNSAPLTHSAQVLFERLSPDISYGLLPALDFRAGTNTETRDRGTFFPFCCELYGL